MKEPSYFICLLFSICLYFTYKITGRGEFAAFAVLALIAAAVLRIVHDAIHHSFPWSKTNAMKSKETKGELSRRERILKSQRYKDMKKARKAGRLDEFYEQDALERAESDKKYEAYEASEADTEYVQVKKDVPGAK